MAEEAAGKIPRAGRRPESSKYIRTERPRVAEFVAGVAVKNALDMEKAVTEIKPELSPVEVAITAYRLEQDPHVQKAIQKTLQKRGLDSESKNYYVQRLWEFFESTDPADEKRQLQAMRILGRGFIAEKVQVDKPEELKIHGFEEGLRRMGLDDESLGRAGDEAYS
jgi:hypothetical protein